MDPYRERAVAPTSVNKVAYSVVLTGRTAAA